MCWTLPPRLAIAPVLIRRDGKGHLQYLLASPDKIARVKHLPSLPYPELPAFFAELRRLQGIPARALEFAILTAGRTGEVIGARWPEIDLTNAVWTVPADRMKAGAEHRVPLAPQALALHRPTLDDVFLRQTGRSLRETAA